MKKIITVFALALIVSSCGKESAAVIDPNPTDTNSTSEEFVIQDSNIPGSAFSVNIDYENCKAAEITAAEKERFLYDINQIRKLHNLNPVVYNYSKDKEAAHFALLKYGEVLTGINPDYNELPCELPGDRNVIGGNEMWVYLSGSGTKLTNSFIAKFMTIGYPMGTSLHIRQDVLTHPRLKSVAFGRAEYGGISIGYAVFDHYSMQPNFKQFFQAYPYGNYPVKYYDKTERCSFELITRPDREADFNLNMSGANVKMTKPNGDTVALMFVDRKIPLEWIPKAQLQTNVKYKVRVTDIEYEDKGECKKICVNGKIAFN